MRYIALICALVSFPAGAQVVYPPVDQATLAIVQSTAQAAQAAAANACQPLAAVPPTEVVGGAAGSGSNCRLVNAVQPRISRTVAFTTGASGTAAITWTDMGATPLVFVVPNIASNATQVTTCFPVVGTISSAGATIKCMTTQSILGLGLVPFVASASGVTGQVLALPAS